MVPFLECYTYKEEMGFNDLLEFSSNFELFPEVIPRQKLEEVYYCVCIYENSDKLRVSSILFVLEICAMQAFIPNLDDNLKLISVLERMIHSQGPNRIPSKTGVNRNSKFAIAGTLFSEKKIKKNEKILDFESLLSENKKK